VGVELYVKFGVVVCGGELFMILYIDILEWFEWVLEVLEGGYFIVFEGDCFDLLSFVVECVVVF